MSLSRKQKNNVTEALKSALRVFILLPFAIASLPPLVLPFPDIIAYIGFIPGGMYSILVFSSIVAFIWFWVALWRQKKNTYIEE